MSKKEGTDFDEAEEPFFVKYDNRKLYDKVNKCYVTLEEIFHTVKSSKFSTIRTKGIEQEELLIKALESQEKTPKKEDVQLLLRIIKNGGFTQYIKKLEGAQNVQSVK